MRAYALMRHARELEASYLASPLCRRNQAHLTEIRKHLGHISFSSYRGIGRNPVSDHGEARPRWEEGTTEDIESLWDDPQGALVEYLLGEDDDLTPSPRAFLSQPEHARQVYGSLVVPTSYEIAELCTLPDLPSNLLGFDIGYWGGGDFSIICDAAIWPVWHPPAPESYAALAEATSVVNQHVLFPTGESAQCYLDWYAEQPWAEKPPEDFTVMAVGAWGE